MMVVGEYGPELFAPALRGTKRMSIEQIENGFIIDFGLAKVFASNIDEVRDAVSAFFGPTAEQKG